MAAELTELGRLAVAQALYNTIGAAVSTEDPDSLRGRLDREARDRYERDGVKSRDVLIGGQKVGTWSVKVSKAVEESVDVRAVVDDWAEFEEWLLGNGLTMAAFIKRDEVLDEFLQWILDALGEVPKGCITTETLHPARAAGYSGTTLRVDTKAVADALKGALPGVVAGLLTGEVE